MRTDANTTAANHYEDLLNCFEIGGDEDRAPDLLNKLHWFLAGNTADLNREWREAIRWTRTMEAFTARLATSARTGRNSHMDTTASEVKAGDWITVHSAGVNYTGLVRDVAPASYSSWKTGMEHLLINFVGGGFWPGQDVSASVPADATVRINAQSSIPRTLGHGGSIR